MARLRRKTVSIKADEARPARADQLEVVPDNALNLPKKSSPQFGGEQLTRFPSSGHAYLSQSAYLRFARR